MMVMTRSRLTNCYPSGKVSSPKTYRAPIYSWFMEKERCLIVRMPDDVIEPIEIGEAVLIWESGSSQFLVTGEFSERLVNKEIDVDKLQTATNATDGEVNKWLGFLLQDYNIEPTAGSIDEVASFIKLWLKEQASKKGLKLEEDELSKLFKFTVRLAYEAFYVGSA